MNTRHDNEKAQLRLYDPDGLAGTRRPRSLSPSAHDKGPEPLFSELQHPVLKNFAYSTTTRAFFEILLGTFRDSELLFPHTQLVYLPSGDAALALPLRLGKQAAVAALISEMAGLSRIEHVRYAEMLGGRLASRAENRAVARFLLDHAPSDTGPCAAYNDLFFAEYRDRCVLDDRGSVYALGDRILSDRSLLMHLRPGTFGLVIFGLD
jgi:hypothetical protein